MILILPNSMTSAIGNVKLESRMNHEYNSESSLLRIQVPKFSHVQVQVQPARPPLSFQTLFSPPTHPFPSRADSNCKVMLIFEIIVFNFACLYVIAAKCWTYWGHRRFMTSKNMKICLKRIFILLFFVQPPMNTIREGNYCYYFNVYERLTDKSAT